MQTTAVTGYPCVPSLYSTEGGAPFPPSTVTASGYITSVTDACTATSSELSGLTSPVRVQGPRSGGSWEPIRTVLEAWKGFSKGERAPALGLGLPGGSRTVATRYFTSVHDKFAAGRPSLEKRIEENLRNCPRLRPFFPDSADTPEGSIRKKTVRFEDDVARLENDARTVIRKIIRDATEKGLYLDLAAAIVTPVLEAACAGALLPGDTDPRDFLMEFGRDGRQRTSELLREARLSVERAAERSCGADLRDLEARSREMSLVRDVVQNAQQWLVEDRYGGLLPGPDGKQLINDTASVQWLLNRVAPRKVGGINVAAPGLADGANQDTVAAILAAIAETIASAISDLPRNSDFPSGLLALAQHAGSSRSAPRASPPTEERELCRLPFLTARAASSFFTLERRHDSREVNIALDVELPDQEPPFTSLSSADRPFSS